MVDSLVNGEAFVFHVTQGATTGGLGSVSAELALAPN
jgi:hypothetical protein